MPKFYERLIGRLPSDAEWAVMDESFHRHYWRLADGCGLAEGAAELLAERGSRRAAPSRCARSRRTTGCCRSSRRTASPPHFLRIDGRTGPSTGGKAEQMARHLAALDGSATARSW